MARKEVSCVLNFLLFFFFLFHASRDPRSNLQGDGVSFTFQLLSFLASSIQGHSLHCLGGSEVRSCHKHYLLSHGHGRCRQWVFP